MNHLRNILAAYLLVTAFHGRMPGASAVSDELSVCEQIWARAKLKHEAMIQASIGYDFASAFGADKASLRLDYQTSSSGQNSFGPGNFDNALSLNTTYQKGRFGFYTDLLGGIGRGTQGDVWGAIFTPSWFIVDQKLQTRCESYAPDIQDTKGIGREYRAACAGLNWYLYGNKIEVMTGLEYSDMTGEPKNFSGWTSFSGMRIAF